MRGSLKTVVLGSVAILGFAHLQSVTGIEGFSLIASAHAEDVTLTDVTFGIKGLTTYRAPSVTFKNPNLDKVALQKLFESSADAGAADLLAGLSADAIVFPELTNTQVETTFQGGLQTRTLIYKNLTLSQIEKGLVRSVSSKDIALKLEGENKNKTTVVTAQGTIGSVDIANYDLPYSVRAVTTIAPLTSTELKPIFETYRMENLKVRYQNVDIVIGSFSLANVKMRPLQTMSFVAFSDPSFRPDADDASPEDEVKGILVTAEMMESIGFDALELKDISIKEPVRGPRGYLTIGLGKTIVVPGKITAENAVWSFPDAEQPARSHTFKMGSLNISGLSFEPTIAALKAISGFKNMDLAFESPQVLQKLIPKLGTWRVDGLALERPGLGEETSHYEIKSTELTISEQINGIPTALKFFVDGLSVDEAAMRWEDKAMRTGEGGQIWLPLGVTRWDMSHNFEYAWNEKAQEILVKDLSFNVKQVGNLRLSGTIGNVPRTLFAFTEESADAFLNATFGSAALDVEDYGIVGKYIASKAESEKQKPEAVRSQLAIQAEAMSMIFLGTGETSKTLGRAIADFITKGKLKAEFKPKNSRELSIFDLVTEEDLQQTLESLSVKVQ